MWVWVWVCVCMCVYVCVRVCVPRKRSLNFRKRNSGNSNRTSHDPPGKNTVYNDWALTPISEKAGLFIKTFVENPRAASFDLRYEPRRVGTCRGVDDWRNCVHQVIGRWKNPGDKKHSSKSKTFRFVLTQTHAHRFTQAQSIFWCPPPNPQPPIEPTLRI